MGEHTVSSFDEDLDQIDRLIRDMGDLAGVDGGVVDQGVACVRQRGWRSAWSRTTPSWTPSSASSTSAPSR